MITGNIEKLFEYFSLYPNLMSVLAFLKSLNSKTSDGLYWVEKDISVTINSYMTCSESQIKFENHRKYIDVHYIVTGNEDIDVMNEDRLNIIEEHYNESDFAIMLPRNPDDKIERIRLSSGDFVVIFPGEAHRPKISASSFPMYVKKAVVKLNRQKI